MKVFSVVFAFAIMLFLGIAAMGGAGPLQGYFRSSVKCDSAYIQISNTRTVRHNQTLARVGFYAQYSGQGYASTTVSVIDETANEDLGLHTSKNNAVILFLPAGHSYSVGVYTTEQDGTGLECAVKTIAVPLRSSNG